MANPEVSSLSSKPFGRVFARRAGTDGGASAGLSYPARSKSFLSRLRMRMSTPSFDIGASNLNLKVLQDEGQTDEESSSSVASNSNSRSSSNGRIALFQDANNVKFSGSASINVFSSTFVTPMATDNALSGVTLVDATGKMLQIPMPLAMSYQVFMNTVKRILNENNKLESRIQRKFVDQNMYDLCMDLGYGVLTIVDQLDWEFIGPGSKIVLRIVLWQEKHEFLKYLCPRFICETWNLNLDSFSVKSIDCRGCDARFQVTDVDYSPLKTTEIKNIGAFGYQTQELASIKNMHLRWQSRSGPTPRRRFGPWFDELWKLINID